MRSGVTEMHSLLNNLVSLDRSPLKLLIVEQNAMIIQTDNLIVRTRTSGTIIKITALYCNMTARRTGHHKVIGTQSCLLGYEHVPV